MNRTGAERRQVLGLCVGLLGARSINVVCESNPSRRRRYFAPLF